MKKNRGSAKVCMIISVIGFLIASASVFTLPLVGNESSGQSALALMTGLLFWAGIIAAIVSFIIAWKFIKCDTAYMKLKKSMRPGYLSVFSSKAAAIADIIFIVTFIVTCIGNIAPDFSTAVTLIAMFLALFTFCLHFLLNGRVYRYIMILQQRREKQDED